MAMKNDEHAIIEPIRLYSGSAIAYNLSRQTAKQVATCLIAHNENEAFGIIQNDIEEKCPSSNGWMNHSVKVVRIPERLMIKVLRSKGFIVDHERREND